MADTVPESMRITPSPDRDIDMPDAAVYEHISQSLQRVNIFMKANRPIDLARSLRNSEAPDARLRAYTFLVGYDFDPVRGERELHIIVSFRVQDALPLMWKVKKGAQSPAATGGQSNLARHKVDYENRLKTLQDALLVVKGDYVHKGARDLSDEHMTIEGLRKRFGDYDEV